jgi:predicted DsbA family dithiol-disulfide isomerase
MQVEIWSDVICPWCYIGKRRFETALADFSHKQDVQVIWHSFELDRNSPSQYSETLTEMLSHKYGVTLQKAEEMNAHVSALAKQIGLEYRLREARPGNTLDAHRLLHFAVSRQLGDKAMECIMRAYFSDALPVGDRAALARLSPEFGISTSDALKMLESDVYIDTVRADEARAADFDISGVPFFVIDGQVGISGAQPIQVFTDALNQRLQVS